MLSSSATWGCVDLVRTDVSEERIASIFLVQKSAECFQLVAQPAAGCFRLVAQSAAGCFQLVAQSAAGCFRLVAQSAATCSRWFLESYLIHDVHDHEHPSRQCFSLRLF
jgi:hypothetical protein